MPHEAFFHWNPKICGLGRQIFWTYVVFSANLSAYILVQWVPCPCFFHLYIQKPGSNRVKQTTGKEISFTNFFTLLDQTKTNHTSKSTDSCGKQCPRTDWVPLHRFFRNWFLLKSIHFKRLLIKYILGCGVLCLWSQYVESNGISTGLDQIKTELCSCSDSWDKGVALFTFEIESSITQNCFLGAPYLQSPLFKFSLDLIKS